MRSAVYRDKRRMQRVSIDGTGDSNPPMIRKGRERAAHSDWHINEPVHTDLQNDRAERGRRHTASVYRD